LPAFPWFKRPFELHFSHTYYWIQVIFSIILRVTVPDQYFCTKHPDLNITAREKKNNAGTGVPAYGEIFTSAYCHPDWYWFFSVMTLGKPSIKKKRNFVNKIHKTLTPRGVPLLWIPIFIFFALFSMLKKNEIFRVKGRFTKPPLNLESPPWTLNRQLKAHSNAF